MPRSKNSLGVRLYFEKFYELHKVKPDPNWLRQAGFTDVDCTYKYYNFAVMTGKKVKKVPLKGLKCF